MIKGNITNKMLKRFPVITSFVEKNKRIPTNLEIADMFNIKAGVGETTKYILEKYLKSLSHCTVCGNKLLNNK